VGAAAAPAVVQAPTEQDGWTRCYGAPGPSMRRQVALLFPRAHPFLQDAEAPSDLWIIRLAPLTNGVVGDAPSSTGDFYGLIPLLVRGQEPSCIHSRAS
jgi:hypothetical protein